MNGMKKFGEQKLSLTQKIQNKELLKDSLFKLRLIAFKQACLYEFEDPNKEDFIQHVRCQLSAYYKTPIKSNIWDSYTDEELIIEYFTTRFIEHPEMGKEFSYKLSPDYKDDTDWLLRKAEEENQRLEEESEEDLSFSPNEIKNA